MPGAEAAPGRLAVVEGSGATLLPGFLDCHVHVSTLPGGAADDLHLRPTSSSSVLFDVAYEPWPTRLASRWSADGGIVFNGLDMLVEQALGQVRLFSGRAQDEPVPDEDVLRDAMRASVGSPIRGRSTTDSVAG